MGGAYSKWINNLYAILRYVLIQAFKDILSYFDTILLTNIRVYEAVFIIAISTPRYQIKRHAVSLKDVTWTEFYDVNVKIRLSCINNTHSLNP